MSDWQAVAISGTFTDVVLMDAAAADPAAPAERCIEGSSFRSSPRSHRR
jgi:hypothetical protein